MIDNLKKIVSDKDINYICFRKTDNTYYVFWFFKTKFECNGSINNLSKRDSYKLMKYIDKNFIYMILTIRNNGKDIIYSNSRSFETYKREELDEY